MGRMQVGKALLVLGVAGVLSGVLAGCATTSSTEAALARRWIGGSVSKFFRENGGAASRRLLSNGETEYVWSGGRGSVSLPGRATTTITGGYGVYTADTIYRPPSAINLGCTVMLTADQNDTITSIQIEEDTIGGWALSRCAEVVD